MRWFQWDWPKTVNRERGTLTLLPNDQIVIGLPSGLDWPQVKFAEFVAAMEAEWEKSPRRRMLVFSFPIDVFDLREKR